MTTTGVPEITADYTAALRDYLAGAQESALVHAYEIGRRAIEGDLGLLDVMAAHQTALAALLEAEARDGTARAVAASMAFLAESLAPFEMAQRGYRAATEAAVRAREEAERASMAKSDFLSRVSHELRTPFNAVLGFAQVLEMDDLTPDQLESVEQIILAGRHLLALIDEVLDISRIESGTLSLSVEPVELNHLVAETVDLVRGMAATRSIQLGMDRDAVAGDTYLLADRQRLKQVLLNLLSNAVKYNREGGAAILSLRRDEDAVLIEVADGGPGIPEDRIDRLFSPFERLGAEQSEVEGTGLGLALSKRLVEAMGGTIGLASTSSQGTTFFVRLPHAASPESALEPSEETARPPAETTRPSRTVLYVEDNLSNLTLVERILSHRPEVQIISAVQGRLGTELATEHRPDLILLDLNLPDISGEEVLRRLKEDPRTRGIPVVVISADTARRQIEAMLEAGAHDYISKPLDVPSFLAVVDEILGR